ncbi:WYL domain-containing protein [Leifsonia sp. F6_8S_P_1B]|uniref:WYL domain-containing protein n=1 Tax=Leifsonia williamsii TaxID=3035919 RepID=A0ABT8K8U8_9MICO|nr:WYL domain-containing protein [Leifsonia williamsii]MDN4613462.1 WYL domain-containing protein [Leifsonia williamsii]
MPLASSSSTSQRLLALLSLLQARRDWPAPVLAERLGVSERTIRRDIDRLRELDYAIASTRGPDGGYRLGAGSRMPPLLLDDEQAVAVAVALQTAGALGAGLGEAAERALGTISRTMPAALAHRVGELELGTSPAPGTQAAETDPEVLLHIARAIRESTELRFDYASAGGEPVPPRPPLRTQPHHLLLHAGRWYLIGYTEDRGDWRIYRVDRIAPRMHNGRRFTPRGVPGGDPASYLSARFKGSEGADTWPCWGEVVLHAPVDAVAPYIGDGVVERLDADRCRVRLGAWSWVGLAAMIGRFDADVEVVGPPELAAAFSLLARRFDAAAAPPR